MVGYVVSVLDGRTFDLQDAAGMVTRLTLGNLVVPAIGTCEGTESQHLLAQLIHGHQVRVDPQSVVWRDDIDVGLAMISYGRAKATSDSPYTYQEADFKYPDYECGQMFTPGS
jgi:endonuclease YncB( thermonuclease family)